MLVDATLFTDEWECLEIRCHELDPLVDRFLVVEGDTTFSGKPREINPIERLKAINPKIEQCVIRHTAKDPWEREHDQRNAILDGLRDLRGGDLVMVSDIDEIPRCESVEYALPLLPKRGIVTFEHKLYYYRLNLHDPGDSWAGARLLKKETLKWPQLLRAIRPGAHEFMLANGGWHFGWLGSPAKVKAKLEAFSHAELNVPEIANLEYLESCQRARFTAHNGHTLERVEIDDTFPKLVREHPERFAHLIEP